MQQTILPIPLFVELQFKYTYSQKKAFQKYQKILNFTDSKDGQRWAKKIAENKNLEPYSHTREL